MSFKIRTCLVNFKNKTFTCSSTLALSILYKNKIFPNLVASEEKSSYDLQSCIQVLYYVPVVMYSVIIHPKMQSYLMISFIARHSHSFLILFLLIRSVMKNRCFELYNPIRGSTKFDPIRGSTKFELGRAQTSQTGRHQKSKKLKCDIATFQMFFPFANKSYLGISQDLIATQLRAHTHTDERR